MIYLLLLIILLIQSTLTSLPLLLLFLLLLTVQRREGFVLVQAFVVGILFDLLTVRSLGLTSLFFVCYVFLILLYQRKYEINTVYFIAGASFIGSFMYLFLFGFANAFPQALVTTLLAVLVFVGLQQVQNRRRKVMPF